MLQAVAHIAELWRYPVKSMRGERVDALDLLGDGIAHDRRWAVESSGAPQGKPLLTGHERAAMLLQWAFVSNGQVAVETSGGKHHAIDDPALPGALESILQQGHRLTVVRGEAPLTDCRPIAITSTQTIERLAAELQRPVDARRFRANILLSFAELSAPAAVFPEDALVGRVLRLGLHAEVRITERDPRCRMVILDPDTAEPDPALMKHLDRHHDGRLGVYAVAATPGPLHAGDPVFVMG